VRVAGDDSTAARPTAAQLAHRLVHQAGISSGAEARPDHFVSALSYLWRNFVERSSPRPIAGDGIWPAMHNTRDLVGLARQGIHGIVELYARDAKDLADELLGERIAP